jgi:predicted dehydrogenase
VTSVAATGWSVVGEHEDVAQARIELADGCVANLFASRVSHRPCRQMQVWTDDGQIEIDFASRRVAVVEPAINARGAAKFEDLLPMRQWEATAQNAILEEQRDFLECIRTGREPLASGAEGLRAIELAETVLASIADARWHGLPQRRAVVANAVPASLPAAQTHPDILRGPHWPRRPISIPARRRKEAG